MPKVKHCLILFSKFRIGKIFRGFPLWLFPPFGMSSPSLCVDKVSSRKKLAFWLLTPQKCRAHCHIPVTAVQTLEVFSMLITSRLWFCEQRAGWQSCGEPHPGKLTSLRRSCSHNQPVMQADKIFSILFLSLLIMLNLPYLYTRKLTFKEIEYCF